MLDVSPSGTFIGKSQIEDYHLQGTVLEAMSLFTFIMEMYEECIKKGSANIEELMDKKTLGSASCTQGHPQNIQCQYQISHQNYAIKQHVICSPGSNMIANFVGPWLPKHGKKDTEELYSASMLILFKPWHDIMALKPTSVTWGHTYNEFLTTASTETCNMIGNIQFYYGCHEAADRDQEENIVMNDGHDDLINDCSYDDSDKDDISVRENLE